MKAQYFDIIHLGAQFMYIILHVINLVILQLHIVNGKEVEKRCCNIHYRRNRYPCHLKYAS